MIIDLQWELIAALRSPDGQGALAEALGPVIAAEMRRALAEQGERLQPLADILGKNRKAATAQLARDPGLRALGIPTGRRLLFRRSDVEAYLRQKRR